MITNSLRQPIPTWASSTIQQEKETWALMSAQDEKAGVDAKMGQKDQVRIDGPGPTALNDEVSLQYGHLRTVEPQGERYEMKADFADNSSIDSRADGDSAYVETSFVDQDGVAHERQISYSKSTGEVNFARETLIYGS